MWRTFTFSILYILNKILNDIMLFGPCLRICFNIKYRLKLEPWKFTAFAVLFAIRCSHTEQILVTSTNCISVSSISGFTLGFVCHFILVLVLISASMKLLLFNDEVRAENFSNCLEKRCRVSCHSVDSTRFPSLDDCCHHGKYCHHLKLMTRDVSSWGNDIYIGFDSMMQCSKFKYYIYHELVTILASAVDNKIIICWN